MQTSDKPTSGSKAFRSTSHYGMKESGFCRLYLRHGIAAAGEPSEVGVWLRVLGYGSGPDFIYCS